MVRSLLLAASLAAASAISATQTAARNEAPAPKAQQHAAKDQKAFIRGAIQGNLAEIEMGKLAQKRSGTAAVKDFGRMLVEDHSAANEKARQIARELKVTPPTRPNLEQRTAYAAQALLHGSRFDRQFARHMVSDHRKDIAAYRAQAQSGVEPVASMARETLPTLEKHLEAAQRLQAQVTAQRR